MGSHSLVVGLTDGSFDLIRTLDMLRSISFLVPIKLQIGGIRHFPQFINYNPYIKPKTW